MAATSNAGLLHMKAIEDVVQILTLGVVAIGGWFLYRTFLREKTDPNECGVLDPWCEPRHKCMSQIDWILGQCKTPEGDTSPSPQPGPGPGLPPGDPGLKHDCPSPERPKWCEPMGLCIPAGDRCPDVIELPSPLPTYQGNYDPREMNADWNHLSAPSNHNVWGLPGAGTDFKPTCKVNIGRGFTVPLTTDFFNCENMYWRNCQEGKWRQIPGSCTTYRDVEYYEVR